jgi:hypothetical protein
VGYNNDETLSMPTEIHGRKATTVSKMHTATTPCAIYLLLAVMHQFVTETVIPSIPYRNIISHWRCAIMTDSVILGSSPKLRDPVRIAAVVTRPQGFQCEWDIKGFGTEMEDKLQKQLPYYKTGSSASCTRNPTITTDTEKILNKFQHLS